MGGSRSEEGSFLGSRLGPNLFLRSEGSRSGDKVGVKFRGSRSGDQCQGSRPGGGGKVRGVNVWGVGVIWSVRSAG